MTFENQYLTYTEYQELGGQQIGETPFNLLEYEARKQIDLRTQNRLKNLETIPQEVKMCMFSLINIIQNYNAATQEAGNVANEQIDGYSIGYITSTQIGEIIASKNVEIQDTIMNNLYGLIVNNEHVIYTGIE